MSHNLMTLADGRTALAYNSKNGIPWHELGTSVDGAMTWFEAMEKAGLNWSVSKRQLFAPSRYNQLGHDLGYLPIEAWGIFRDDNGTFLGTVGKQYTPIQNQQAFDFVDSLIEVSGAHYDTAGALFNGERIFVSATIPYSIAPDRAPNDISNCYLMFETSHDGSMSATAKLTTIRVVCNNTLSAALNNRGFGTLKVRHSPNGVDKINQAKRLFQGVTQSVESLKTKFDILSNRRIGKTESNDIMDSLFGADWKESATKRNQIERIASLFELNDRNAFPEIKGSAYAMLQSITNWVDHEKSIRATDHVNGLTTDQIRTQSAVFNGGDDFKSKAMEVILSATKDSPAMPEVVHSYRSVNVPKSSIDNILDSVTV